MDVQTKLFVAPIILAGIGYATFALVLRYCRWLHERGIKDPEARVAIILNAWRRKDPRPSRAIRKLQGIDPASVIIIELTSATDAVVKPLHSVLKPDAAAPP